MVIELGHRPDGGAGRAHRVGLVDGDGRRYALDAVDLRLVHAVEELPGVRRERLDVAALALGVDGVEHQRGLAGPRDPGDDHQLPQRHVEVEVAQVVLTRPADPNAIVALRNHGGFPGPHGAYREGHATTIRPDR